MNIDTIREPLPRDYMASNDQAAPVTGEFKTTVTKRLADLERWQATKDQIRARGK